MKLKPSQLEGLHCALLSAFYSEATLKRMALFKLGENLDAIVGGVSLSDKIFDLIVWAEANGRTEDLIVGARQSNRGNPNLMAFAAEVTLSSAVLPTAGGKLESIVVEGVKFQDVSEWRNRMDGIVERVCVVEDQNGQGFGTGFLVARNIIMTNQHVTEILIRNGGVPQVRFGYIKNLGGPGADNGRVVKFAAQNWELISDPPSGLDFSLLQLAENAGEDNLGARQRGWLKPDIQHDFKKDEPMMILQHPQIQPMKFAAGYLRDYNQQTRRIAYTMNTKGGSSGSPCFDLNWDLIAIHHEGDDFTNHGVPMKFIVEFLNTKGRLNLLG